MAVNDKRLGDEEDDKEGNHNDIRNFLQKAFSGSPRKFAIKFILSNRRKN